MPWVACPWWSLPGTAKTGSCPLFHREILPWLSFRSCFLPLLFFFSLSFSYVLFFGTRLCFLLPERKLESSNNSSRKSPNLSSLKLPFPRKGSFAISNSVQPWSERGFMTIEQYKGRSFKSKSPNILYFRCFHVFYSAFWSQRSLYSKPQTLFIALYGDRAISTRAVQTSSSDFC